MPYKTLTDDHLYTSYKAYEVYVESEVKAGRMEKSAARILLNKAKENYRNRSYNRQVDIINEG